MSRTNDLNALFDEWKELHAAENDKEYFEYHKILKENLGYIPKQNFLGDGILFEDFYNKSEKKVLFIAKECNAYYRDKKNKIEILTDSNGFWAKNEVETVLNNGVMNNSFLNGIAMLYNAMISNDYSTPNKSATSLSNIAFINLNKRGGYESCVWDTLEGYVRRYYKMIAEQIRIIDPDVIVCCGESVKYFVDEYDLAGNREIRCAYHPSCFSVSDKNKLQFLKTGKKAEKAEKEEQKQSTDRECRGYILDTNNKYGVEYEKEMMNDSRAYAYGSARDFLGWFKEDDFVLYYSADKKGVIAVGQVKSTGDDDKNDKSWWTVKPIVPIDFLSVNDNPTALSMSVVNRIVYDGDAERKINMRGTVKRKTITINQVNNIINEMKRITKK